MYYKSPLTYLLVILFIFFFYSNLAVVTEQQFVRLAESFLNHTTEIQNPYKISDLAYFSGKYYWPLGPFPAIPIMPFKLLLDNFLQGFIQFPLSFVNFYLVYKIARKFKLNHERSLLMSTFFIFGSIYTPLAAIPGSWYYSQTLACTLILLSIWLFFYNRMYFLIGILLACAVATRFSLILASTFFIYFAIREKAKVRNLTLLVTPVLLAILVLAAYNHTRFNNFFESGYNYQLVPEQPLARRNEGLFSLKHIPSNLYYMLFKGPEPIFQDSSHTLKAPYLTFDNYGLSIFFLSPILLLIFAANYKKRSNLISIITSFLIMIPIITYYGIGQKQVGYRYALDFFPFLFLIVADTQSKLNTRMLKLMVYFGVFFSIYFTIMYLSGEDIAA